MKIKICEIVSNTQLNPISYQINSYFNFISFDITIEFLECCILCNHIIILSYLVQFHHIIAENVFERPPVAAPDAIAFHGSSFFLMYVNVQSQIENNVPHTAKLPTKRKENR